MSSSSSLKVLIIGNNPNVLLYASRFQLAKSIQLYHVNDSESSVFQMETFSYGKDQIHLKNHFPTIPSMISDFSQSGESNPSFDLIILSSDSLQDISSVASQLNPIVNKNTKIVIESSGFVQLEPFVKMSIDVPQLHIFSILSDYDIRQVNANEYKQFPNPNTSTSNTLYLGSTQPIAGSKVTSSSAKYSKNVVALLETFERLFKKLFPKDTIDLCNCSESGFLSQEWTFAIPRICFDPLLILLDEQSPSELPRQILAKPLISGLVTELITVAKSMNAKLPSSMDNENNLLKYWQSLYPTSSDIPSLVYHFINRTSSLDIDILLLQPILLADDNSIKTPYLEFLYSVLCQYQKFNNGESKWFVRSEDVRVPKEEIKRLTRDKDQLKENIEKMNYLLQEKDVQMKYLQNAEIQSKTEVENLRKQINDLKLTLGNQTKEYENQISMIENNNSRRNVSETTPDQTQKSLNHTQTQLQHQQYTSTGTPIMNDLEGLIYSVSIASKDATPILPAQQQYQPVSQGTAMPNSKEELDQQDPETDRAIEERELELRRKELELQERELEFQKRAMQQQQRHAVGPGQMNCAYNGLQPATNNNSRKSSYQQLQQPVNTRPNRSMYGASTSSAGNFADPLAPHTGKSGYQSSMGMPAQQSYSIKPTSRKNRNSKLPTLGYASAAAMGNVNGPHHSSNPTLESLSSQSLPAQNRSRQSINNHHPNSAPRMNMPRASKSNSFTIGNQPLQNTMYQQNAQRLYSSSTIDNINPDVSLNSVVHNPVNNNDTFNHSQNFGSNIVPSTPTKAPQMSVPHISISTFAQPGVPSNIAGESSAGPESATPENSSESVEKEKEKKKKFKLFGKKK